MKNIKELHQNNYYDLDIKQKKMIFLQIIEKLKENQPSAEYFEVDDFYCEENCTDGN